MRETEHPGGPSIGLALVAALVAVAALLRFPGALSFPLAQDELYTLRDVRNLFEAGPGVRPLYFLLLYPLAEWFDATPFLLRLPALLFGIGGVGATWVLAKQWFDRDAALVAALLAALSPWHLYVSQFARYWSLLYLLFAVLLILSLRIFDRPTSRDCLGALALIGLGALAHPTWMFALVGLLPVLLISGVPNEGERLFWGFPGGTEWKYLWAPLFVAGLLSLTVVLSSVGIDRLTTTPRGIRASVTFVLGVVEWLNPTIVVLTVVGLAAVWRLGSPKERLWVIAAGAVGTTTVGGLLLASFVTGVYPDYAIYVLPLSFVTVGALGSKIADWAPLKRGPTLAAMGLLVVVMLAPQTVSHLRDGSRFNYRAIYERISEKPAHLVVGWPRTMKEYYAPHVPFRRFYGEVAELEKLVQREEGFWLITSYRERGLVNGGEDVIRWISANCRLELREHKFRFDVRSYEVRLHWCGSR